MNTQVSRDFSHLKSFFCALRQEIFPDVRDSLLLSRDKNKSLLNGNTSGAEIRAAFLACSEALTAAVCVDHN